MKTWSVEVGFEFVIGGPEHVPSNDEVIMVLSKRLGERNMRPTKFEVRRGKDQDVFIKDLGRKLTGTEE